MAVETVSEPDKTVSRGRIARNTTIYLAAQLLSWMVSLLTVSIIPRRLGEQAVGELAVLGSAFGPVGALLWLGLESHLTKEIGRDPRQTERLLGGSIGLRFAMHPIGITACLIGLYLIHPSPSLWHLGIWWIALNFPGSITELLRSTLAAWEQAKQVSALDLLSTITPVLMIPFLRYGPMAVIVSNSLMAVVVLLIRLRWVGRDVRIRPVFDLLLWKSLVRGGIPFVLTGFIGTLYGTIGTLMLRHFTNDATVGIQSQAVRLFGTFLFIPTALGYALLPQMARLADTNQEEFRRTQTQVLGLLIVLSLPIMTLMFFLAHPLCRMLYGPVKFASVPAALQVYAFALLPMYIVTTMYQFLVAQGRAAVWNLFFLATAALFTLFAFIGIPLTLRTLHDGILGMVGATVLAESCAAVFALTLLKVNPFTPDLLGRLSRALAATAGMAVVMWMTRGLFLAVPAALGSVTFIFLAWLLRVLTPEEQRKIVRLVLPKLFPKAVIAQPAGED